jgi:hypothetical protein
MILRRPKKVLRAAHWVRPGPVRQFRMCERTNPSALLPSENLLPLYRARLEINMELTSAALGIQQDKVCVISERSITGLNAEEADEIIKRVAHYADQLDDQLAAEFGARLVTKA